VAWGTCSAPGNGSTSRCPWPGPAARRLREHGWALVSLREQDRNRNLAQGVEIDVRPRRIERLAGEAVGVCDHRHAIPLGHHLPGAGAEDDLDEFTRGGLRLAAPDQLQHGGHGLAKRLDRLIVRDKRYQRRLVSADCAEELGLAGDQAKRDRRSERVGNHVRRREAERLDQGGEVVLVVAARPGLGAVLAAGVATTVVADHAEAAREVVFDERPRPPVVPAPVNQDERVAAACSSTSSRTPLTSRSGTTRA
jgi:hypothetical protein